MRILLTGVTGFVGSELARTLLADNAVEHLWVVIRPQAGMRAAERWQKLVKHWERFFPPLPARMLERVTPLEHDLEGLRPLVFPAPVDVVIHSAAQTDLAMPLIEARRTNLYATQRVVAAALRSGGAPLFVHLSTAYVCGRRKGLIREDDAPAPFHNHYERSKLESEHCVKDSGLPHVIVRPSIIVGRSDDGYVLRMKVMYTVWRTWLYGLIPRAPLDPRAWVDIVPVDHVVSSTLMLMRLPAARGQAFHVAAGEGRLSPATIMMDAVKTFGVPVPPLSPPWVVDVLRLPFIRPLLSHGMTQLLDVMYHHVPYLGIRDRVFSTDRADRLLAPHGISCPRFADYGETIFRFCLDTQWGKKARMGSRGEAPGLSEGQKENLQLRAGA